MKSVLIAICLSIFLNCRDGFAKSMTIQDDNELISVAVLFRDGDKTPTSSFPNDPYFDATYWPMGFGQLTEIGITRQYELGQWLRTRYGSFLPEEYFSKDIYVRSTDVDRALMSAAANLAGLYPPTSTQVWNNNLPWRPIPIHTIPSDEDQVLYMNSDCPKFYEVYETACKDDFFVNINKEYAEFYQKVSELTGWEVDDIDYLSKLQTVLYIYTHYNSSYLPSWSSELDEDKLNYLAGLSYARYTFNDELKRLGAGPFFDYLISHFDNLVSETPTLSKFLMLSGHESTLVAALNSMGVFDFKSPAFASSILWEVRKNGDGNYFVNMYYKEDDSTDVPDELKLENCDFDCEYGEYKGILNPFTINMTVWEQECNE